VTSNTTYTPPAIGGRRYLQTTAPVQQPTRSQASFCRQPRVPTLAQRPNRWTEPCASSPGVSPSYVAKARMIRGERYWLKCANAVSMERLLAAEKSAARTRPSSFLAPTRAATKMKSSVNSGSVLGNNPARTISAPNRGVTPTSAPSQLPNCCPANHQLRTSQTRIAFVCTECRSAVPRNSTRYACKQCLFALCSTCGCKTANQNR
jgi:hypothetical protein